MIIASDVVFPDDDAEIRKLDNAGLRAKLTKAIAPDATEEQLRDDSLNQAALAIHREQVKSPWDTQSTQLRTDSKRRQGDGEEPKTWTDRMTDAFDERKDGKSSAAGA